MPPQCRQKSTIWSWAPYAVAFGLLPAIATLARPTPRWPEPWAIAAGALLGVAAHFANVLPDLATDADLLIMGGEINAEMERQTAKDTTVGIRKPMGARGAAVADQIGRAHR